MHSGEYDHVCGVTLSVHPHWASWKVCLTSDHVMGIESATFGILVQCSINWATRSISKELDSVPKYYKREPTWPYLREIRWSHTIKLNNLILTDNLIYEILFKMYSAKLNSKFLVLSTGDGSGGMTLRMVFARNVEILLIYFQVVESIPTKAWPLYWTSSENESLTLILDL